LKNDFNGLPFDRNVPRKPRLVGGVKGHNIKRDYLAGKPRPMGGELHILERKSLLKAETI
jgi:hypothetical protein